MNIKLASVGKKFKKLVAKLNYKFTTLFLGNLLVVHINNKKKFHQTLYVGIFILDLPKHKMYDFHYNVIKPKYKLRLIYVINYG